MAHSNRHREPGRDETTVPAGDLPDAFDQPETGATEQRPSRISRRDLFGAGLLGLGGAAIGAAATGIATGGGQADTTDATPGDAVFGQDTVSPYGAHQAGVETEPQAFASFVGYDLRDGVDAEAAVRMLRLLTDDIERLTSGDGALADSEPELAQRPSRLTITLGFGRALVELAGDDRVPSWLAPLPAFSVDQLQDRWTGGDFLIQVCADDPVTVAHAVRVLERDARSFVTLRWHQQGFRNANGAAPKGTTMRNLLGQVDGTQSIEPGTDDFRTTVWGEGRTGSPDWMAGGTSLVIRRIRMELDTWDQVTRAGREEAIGRTLDNGAPLTGNEEHDQPDLDAVNELGLPVINTAAHIRRAHMDDTLRIHRRPYNYQVLSGDDGNTEAGLIFAAYQANPVDQFVPLQQRIAEADLLNIWTIPIGSSVFAIPPGFQPGGYVGDTLFGQG